MISQYIFLSMKGKKVKQSNSLATDGEQDQLGKSLLGVERKNCRDASMEGIMTPTCLGRLYFSSLKSFIQGKIKFKELSRTIHLSQHEHVLESTGIKAQKSLSPVTVQGSQSLGGAGEGDADTGLHNGHYRAGP